MRNKLKKIYENSALSTKIRYSYVLMLIPIILMVIICMFNLWNSNRQYDAMINSVVMASEFSLDFKKDFDYEAYLLIVENKTVEESGMQEMLEEAKRIVNGLEKLTDSEPNIKRLESLKKYLENLEIYKGRIEENLKNGNMYEINLQIWENDIQIVTSLFKETIFEYIYYETKDIQTAQEEKQREFANLMTWLVIAFLFITVLVIFISYFIPQSITKPIRQFSKVTKKVADGDLTVRSNVKAGEDIKVLNDSLNYMIDKINELMEQNKLEQIRLRKAEFEILQSQINPHFLYNTLDTIVWLAEAGQQEKVVSMVESLSGFFRASLNQGRDIVSIKEELVHVRSYLEIQQVRYQDILDYKIDVPEELNKYLIPKITIQPLVENALYHGIKNKRGLGHIIISGEQGDKDFILTVRDDGIGMTEERLGQVRDGISEKLPTEKEIYGIYNVNERIRLNFGEEYGIDIESKYTEGTVVKVILPHSEKSEEEIIS